MKKITKTLLELITLITLIIITHILYTKGLTAIYQALAMLQLYYITINIYKPIKTK